MSRPPPSDPVLTRLFSQHVCSQALASYDLFGSLETSVCCQPSRSRVFFTESRNISKHRSSRHSASTLSQVNTPVLSQLYFVLSLFVRSQVLVRNSSFTDCPGPAFDPVGGADPEDDNAQVGRDGGRDGKRERGGRGGGGGRE